MLLFRKIEESIRDLDLLSRYRDQRETLVNDEYFSFKISKLRAVSPISWLGRSCDNICHYVTIRSLRVPPWENIFMFDFLSAMTLSLHVHEISRSVPSPLYLPPLSRLFL